MKLQKILSRLQKLHPKEIDLSLDRIKKLCKKLGNPQDNLQYISVVGTNGKYSTIQAIRAILKDANINCNIYTSPHIQVSVLVDPNDETLEKIKDLNFDYYQLYDVSPQKTKIIRTKYKKKIITALTIKDKKDNKSKFHKLNLLHIDMKTLQF